MARLAFSGNAGVIMPRVISVSRATDIPAFYPEWILERLHNGYCEWRNPFNARQTQLVSFEQCKAIVFWSKNPSPIMSRLPEIDALGIKYYFQFTLNDYEAEGLEPGIPTREERIRTFIKLSEICPVVWRYDPVIMGCGLTVKEHLRRIKGLMGELARHTENLIFSFVDITAYKRVEARLKASKFREASVAEMHEFSSGLTRLNSTLEKPLKLHVCGEEMDTVCDGIPGSRCIDPEMLEALAHGTEEGRHSLVPLRRFDHSKDKGQRKLCGCAVSKDIGSYRMQPCRHHCLYCYAGHCK